MRSPLWVVRAGKEIAKTCRVSCAGRLGVKNKLIFTVRGINKTDNISENSLLIMEICCLLAFPDADDDIAPVLEQFKGLKDAPYFQPVDIDLVTLGEETVVIEGYAVTVTRQRYDGRVQMVACRFDLIDPFASSVLQLRAKIQSALQCRYIPETYRQSGLYED